MVMIGSLMTSRDWYCYVERVCVGLNPMCAKAKAMVPLVLWVLQGTTSLVQGVAVTLLMRSSPPLS